MMPVKKMAEGRNFGGWGYLQPWQILGCDEDPFSDLKGEHAFVETAGVELVRQKVQDAITQRSIHVLVANQGYGKTTAMAAVFEEIERKYPKRLLIPFMPEDSKHFSIVKVRREILTVARAAGVSVSTDPGRSTEGSVRRALLTLQGQTRYPDGIALVFDNAHDYPDHVVRSIRQLIESPMRLRQHLCGVVFLGWTRLEDIVRGLRDVGLRAKIHELPPLTPEEINDFVRHRIRAAGGNPDEVVTPEAIEYLTTRDRDGDGNSLRTPAEVLRLLRDATEIAAKIGRNQISDTLIGRADSHALPLKGLWIEFGRPSMAQIAAAILDDDGRPLMDRTTVNRIINSRLGSREQEMLIAAAIRKIGSKQQEAPATASSKRPKKVS